jgi:asparagine synthase (glutamine-hydrolysing)
MRRALAGIVPDEILNRRRKAYVARGPIAAVQAQWPALAELGHNMISASLGVVDEKAFGRMLQSTRQNKEPFTVALSRTLLFEAWIRCLAARGMLVAASQPTGPASAWPAVDFSAEKN